MRLCVSDGHAGRQEGCVLRVTLRLVNVSARPGSIPESGRALHDSPEEKLHA
jgi:hypothetical protein